MPSLDYSPVFYGIQDVTVESGSTQFANRIYYPSFDGTVFDAPIRPGTYPLVVFAHGDRSSEVGLCPTDRTRDHEKWDAVLHLLARCGLVVSVPAVHDTVSSSEETAVRIELTVSWMRNQWAERSSLRLPAEFVAVRSSRSQIQREIAALPYSVNETETMQTFQVGPFPNLGLPTPLGLVGHSWGARACARAAVRGNVRVKALAAVAGTWDENASIMALSGANVPTFLMAGSADFITLSYMIGLWPNLVRPKHQALVQGLGHWDWFGGQGGIHPCNPNAPRPPCPVGWQVASELLLAFMVKYLWNEWWRPPYLLGSPGGRPPILPWFEDSQCALKIRWDDPASTTSLPGQVTLGSWSDTLPW